MGSTYRERHAKPPMACTLSWTLGDIGTALASGGARSPLSSGTNASAAACAPPTCNPNTTHSEQRIEWCTER